MGKKKKVVVLAPYWVAKGHVGLKRLNYFISWLTDAGCQIVLVSTGRHDSTRITGFGKEIYLKDPFQTYFRRRGKAKQGRTRRVFYSVARDFLYRLLIPDPLILWARRVAKNALVQKEVESADLILSSSPPESTHHAACCLGKRFEVPAFVDLRDGWLDEPLRDLLKKSKVQRWREGRMEKRILSNAHRVFVTSPGWKKVLVQRVPQIKGKLVTLLTPCDERIEPDEVCSRVKSGSGIVLCYAGRFTGSSSTRRAGILLENLYQSLARLQAAGEIRILGDIEPCDLREIDSYIERFSAMDWDVKVSNAIPADRVSAELHSVHGLLMLSTSKYAIPSKFGTYLSANKPILVFTHGDSDIWDIYRQFDQVFLFDIDAPGEGVCQTREFIEAVKNCSHRYKIPDEFSEQHAKRLFLAQLDRV